MTQLTLLEPHHFSSESESEQFTQAKALLKQYYGYTEFYPAQQIIINTILKQKNTLAIMPTGAGKSVCFQIPALLLPGVTLVFSPLIALMKDQVDALNNIGIPATFINSTLSMKQLYDLRQSISRGAYKLIYIAPERIRSLGFKEWIDTLTVSMVVIDEVHCLSAWGHDFRPSYLDIASFIHALPSRPLVTAFTATATEEVQDDILEALNLPDIHVHLAGFDRENLNLQVFRGEQKDQFVLNYLKQHPVDSGIIYAATRKEVDKIYEYLKEENFSVAKYHAGLPDAERKQAQESFIYDQVPILVATNAFGMGIDKSNIRFIIHYNMPRNMESYYQEAGRAGRDRDKGECILLFAPGDIQLQKFMIEQSTLDPVRKVNEYQKLQFMVDYCHSDKCLRQTILSYFGEKNSPDSCGNCSFCLLGEWVDITEEAKLIFNCIVQIRQRFGLNLVVDILRGSKSKKLLQANLDTLPVYGTLSHYRTADLKDIIQLLISQNYLSLTEGEYPVLKLEISVKEVLREGQTVRYKAMPKQTAVAEQTKEESLLMTRLKDWRYHVAEQSSLPAYLIFSDRTLRDIADQQPQSVDDLLLIQGISINKAERYGQDLLAILQAEPLVKTKVAKASQAPSHLVSLELFNQGHSIEEIAETREMVKSTIEQHILSCASEGYEVNLDPLIPAEYEDLIRQTIQTIGAQKLKPIKEALPEDVSYTAIKAVLVKYSQ